MKLKKRYGFVRNLIAPILISHFKRTFKLKFQKCDLKPPFLVLANHTTDYDAFFLSGCFKCPIYFVMSDHVSSIPFFGKIIKFLLRPLPITKSGVDFGVVREIMSVTRQGGAVGIFPEGNKSFAGDVSFIKPSTAKLAKKLNIPLVLFNIEGGYFSQPRWGKSKRKGEISAYVKEIIMPDEIQKMSNDELYSRIVEGLRVNAYEIQAKSPVDFKGKRLAEGIETMLYACPECGSISTIKSHDNKFWCSACGNTHTYLENGHILGSHFDRLDDWDKWQKNHIKDLKLSHYSNDTPILHDINWHVAQKKDKYNNKNIGVFETFLFADRLLVANKKQRMEFKLDQIVGMGVEGANSLQISLHDGQVFRLRNKAGQSALKYADFIWTIQQKQLRF